MFVSVFICVHLWTFFISTKDYFGESKPGALPDQVATSTNKLSILIFLQKP